MRLRIGTGGSAYPVGFRLVPPVQRTPPDGLPPSPLPLLGAVVLAMKEPEAKPEERPKP